MKHIAASHMHTHNITYTQWENWLFLVNIVQMFIHPLWLSSQVYVATFAISAYASSYHRAGSKPFNPVLGETYECDRPDKGYRFIAEQVEVTHLTTQPRFMEYIYGKYIIQHPVAKIIVNFILSTTPLILHLFSLPQVSHHPPVSACHSDSRNFTFWQGEREETNLFFSHYLFLNIYKWPEKRTSLRRMYIVSSTHLLFCDPFSFRCSVEK